MPSTLRLQRKLGMKGATDLGAYMRFDDHPKSVRGHILFRGDTRDPQLIRTGGGFFPQRGRHGVSSSGGSSSMVCLTLSLSVAATYYAFVKNYFGSPTWGTTNRLSKQGFVFACFVPTGQGVLNYRMAQAVGSRNAGSREISTLAVPWSNVIGWRQLPKPEDCKPNGAQNKLADFVGAYTANPAFDTGKLTGEMIDASVSYEILQHMDEVLVYNSNAL